MTSARRAGLLAEPYWRRHQRVFRNGRLEWYGDEPSEEFWDDLWQQRLLDDYYAPADTGDLRDLETVLTGALDRGGRQVEAGCGLGYWVAALRARGYDVTGVESSRSLVDAVTTVRPDLGIRHGDALCLDAPDGTFDGYLSFGVVEHRQQGPEPFLGEAYRVLKPGGRIVISVPFLCPFRAAKAKLGCYRRRPPHGAEFFQYAFGEGELRALLVAAGFTVDAAHYQQPQRCLVEELPGYFRLNRMRGGRLLRKPIVSLAPARLAGHMVLLVGTRPR